MPVKVVSEKPVKTKRVTCPNCAYELEYTGEDVSSSVDGYGDISYTIRCPRTSCRHWDGGSTRISVTWP